MNIFLTHRDILPTKQNLKQRKSFFCYKYLDSLERLEETALPSREAFFSKLKNNDITLEEYNRALNIWNVFGMKTLGEYIVFYSELGTLLLADIFEKFRNIINWIPLITLAVPVSVSMPCCV